MTLVTIDGHYFNLDKVVALIHVPAPSGRVDFITTDIIFDFAIGNEPYKIHIDKPVATVLSAIKPHLPKSS